MGGPSRLINLDHQGAVLEPNRSDVASDEIAHNFVPPAEEAPDLAAVRATQPPDDTVEGLRQRGESILHPSDRIRVTLHWSPPHQQCE